MKTKIVVQIAIPMSVRSNHMFTLFIQQVFSTASACTWIHADSPTLNFNPGATQPDQLVACSSQPSCHKSRFTSSSSTLLITKWHIKQVIEV